MHDQGPAVLTQPEASSPAGMQRAAALQELRAGVADAERRVDRLMVMRRRELAGLSAEPQTEPELEPGA